MKAAGRSIKSIAADAALPAAWCAASWPGWQQVVWRCRNYLPEIPRQGSVIRGWQTPVGFCHHEYMRWHTLGQVIS
jgi:hypothetical protein